MEKGDGRRGENRRGGVMGYGKSNKGERKGNNSVQVCKEWKRKVNRRGHGRVEDEVE